MNWNPVIHVLITVILKLITTSLFLLYFPQIFSTSVQQKKHIPEDIKGCSIRWEPFKGKCYFFSTQEETWDNSQKACTRFGSNLAIVNHKEELMFLKSRAKSEQYFIGLIQRDGRWTWIDGTELDPKILDIQQGRFPCVVVGLDSVDALPCYVGYRYICEKKA